MNTAVLKEYIKKINFFGKATSCCLQFCQKQPPPVGIPQEHRPQAYKSYIMGQFEAECTFLLDTSGWSLSMINMSKFGTQ